MIQSKQTGVTARHWRNCGRTVRQCDYYKVPVATQQDLKIFKNEKKTYPDIQGEIKLN